MDLTNFYNVRKNTSNEVDEYVNLSMDILDRIDFLIKTKFNGSQKEFALHIGKSEAEVSKWLNGIQNFTIKTLAKLNCSFGEPVIQVPKVDYSFQLPVGGFSSISLQQEALGNLKSNYSFEWPLSLIDNTEILWSKIPIETTTTDNNANDIESGQHAKVIHISASVSTKDESSVSNEYEKRVV